MHRRAVFRALVAGAAVAGLAACGASDAAAPDVPATIGDVGALPGALALGSTVPPTTPPTRPPTTPPTEGESPSSEPTTPGASMPVRTSRDERINDGTHTIGSLVEGNRVLVIGDSILASVSNRYGDQLCQRLVPRGWVVEVDAEVGRFVEFGRQVLDRRPPDDWDAAVVMLGNNDRGDPQAFQEELSRLLDELEPLPVVLLSVTRFEPEQDGVNYVLVSEAKRRDDVQLLDWAGRTAEDVPDVDEVLTGDGLHLTPYGQAALAAMISRAMGAAPTGTAGECLRSTFRDDDGGFLPAASRGDGARGSADGESAAAGGGAGTAFDPTDASPAVTDDP